MGGQPVRRCAVCRQRVAKKELDRFVWRADGVVFDRLQKMAGRGAYCCSGRCREKFLTEKRYWKVVFRIR